MAEETVSKPIIYACSGCSDAGELADRIARRLNKEGVGQMSCLAGVGGRVKHLVAVAERADRILVIDGCLINCARKTLELAGVRKFEHLALQELGFRKGSCPVTEANIAAGAAAAKELLAETTAVPATKGGAQVNRSEESVPIEA
jgi:uncharacterized metal-binding protein